MKEMNKAKIIDKKSDKSVKSERDLLSKLNHPFIVNMHYSFQDGDNLYLVMDLLTGGDLRYHICKKKYFTEEQTKFFISCILLGLEYIHYYRIIHRDIKPENLVLDSKGYIHITDFGIAKIQQKNNYKETSGTPGYMSPEVLCGQNHTTVADYFPLGIMGYELMKGKRPYLGSCRKQIKEKIMAKQIIIHRYEIKEGWSIEATDFINRLLQRKPARRLGINGINEIKNHIWFRNYPWIDLYNHKLISPFIPPKEDNFDYKYCNHVERQSLITKERYAEIMISDNYKSVFKDYLYFNRSEIKNTNNIYQNIHEKMYHIFNMHNRNRSVATDFSHYRNNSINKLKVNEDIKNEKKYLVNHARAFSSIGLVPNKAFIAANNYINSRKITKKNLLLDNYRLESKNSRKNFYLKQQNNTFTKNKIKIFIVKNNMENITSQNNNSLIVKEKENINHNVSFRSIMKNK